MAIVDELIGILGYEFRDNGATDKFNRGLDRAERGFGKFAKRAAQFGALAGAAVGGFIGFQAKNVLRTSGEFERFSAILETIEGSSEKAQQSLDWIKQFGKTTPYEVAGITDAFVKLKAYGIDPIANDTLRTLGDTAAAMGKPLNQAVEALADAATGEFERLKEFGLKASQAGDEVTFRWSQNGEELTKTVGKNSEEIRQFILDNFGSRFAGAMAKQSNTWGGMLSNLSDYWTDFQLKIGEAGYFDAAKKNLRGVLDWLDRLEADGTLQAWAQTISNVMTAGMNFIGAGIERVGRHVTFLTQKIRDNKEWFDKWGKTLAIAAGLFMARVFPMTTLFVVLGLAIDDFLTYLEGGESVIGKFIDKMLEMFPFLEGLPKLLEGINTDWLNWLLVMFVFSPSLVMRLMGGIFRLGFLGLPKILFAGLKRLGPVMWRGIRTLAPIMWRGLTTLGPLLVRGILALAPMLGSAIGGLFALISNPIGWAVLAVAAASAIIYFFWDEIVAAWNTVKEKGGQFMQDVLAWWSDNGGLLGIGASLIQALWEGLKAIWDAVISWGGGLLSAMFTWFEDQGGLKGIGETLFNAYWEGLKAIWGQIGEWAGGLLDGLIFFFTGKDTNFAEAGRNVINAFFDGLKSIGSQIVDWFWGMLPAPLKNFLQGTGDFVQGAGQAISDGAGIVADKAGQAANFVGDQASAAGNYASDVADATLAKISNWWSGQAPEISTDALDAAAANIANATAQAGVNAQVADQRQDNRDQSIHVHPSVVVNQTVTQPTAAPSAVANRTGSEVAKTIPSRAITGAGR